MQFQSSYSSFPSAEFASPSRTASGSSKRNSIAHPPARGLSLLEGWQPVTSDSHQSLESFGGFSTQQIDKNIDLDLQEYTSQSQSSDYSRTQPLYPTEPANHSHVFQPTEFPLNLGFQQADFAAPDSDFYRQTGVRTSELSSSFHSPSTLGGLPSSSSSSRLFSDYVAMSGSAAFLADNLLGNNIFEDHSSTFLASSTSYQGSSLLQPKSERNPFSPLTPDQLNGLSSADISLIPPTAGAQGSDYQNQWAFLGNQDFNPSPQQHLDFINNAGSYTPSYHSQSDFGSIYGSPEVKPLDHFNQDPSAWRNSKLDSLSLCS